MTEDGGKRRFKGTASTPSTDRQGDIVEPKGAVFKLPIPLIWMHDSRDPIGWITGATVGAKGIEVEGEVADIAQEGELKNRLLKAWQMIQAKLVRGLSIGFNPLESARIDGTFGEHFLKWEWLELSAVTIPANQEATITAVKSIDDALLAASGKKQSVQRPGVSGNQKGNGVKTLKELQEARQTKAARLTELIELKKAENRGFNDDEAGEFDGLTAEVKELDDEIRVFKWDQINSGSAAAVKGGGTEEGSRSRAGISFVKKEDPDDKFKGQAFTRFCIAKAMSYMQMREGNLVPPAVIAKALWGKTNPKLVEWIHAKAAVAGGGTGSGEWGAELAQSDTRFTGDFIEFLYSRTIFDRLPLREIPARVHVKGQDGAATGYWVGESKAIPASKADFSDVELTPLKVGAIAAVSKELVRDSSPAAERLVRDSLVEASSQRVDTTFLSATAASAGVSPAGLLNGLTAVVPSGVDADAVRNDLMSLYLPIIQAKNASGLVQIMTPSMAKALQLLRNSLGQREFPDIRADGGTLEGDPVFTGDNVTGGYWIILKPSDIYKIGDTGVEVSMSDQATIEQNDAPQGAGDTPTAASATLISLWQEEQIGFKVVRPINYAKRRTSTSMMNWLDNAEYGGVVS